SDVAQLIEQNNHIEHLLTSIGYFLWTDGKLGAYVRYVADGQRFGFHDENILAAIEVPLGEDVYACPQCGKDSPGSTSPVIPNEAERSEESLLDAEEQRDSSGASLPRNDTKIQCSSCHAELTDASLRLAERVSVPRVVGSRLVPNGQEVITIAG